MSLDRFKKGNHKILQTDVQRFFDSKVSSGGKFPSNLQKSNKLSSDRDINEYNRVINDLISLNNKQSKNIKVLDLGCGVGRLARYFKESKFYLGLDFSNESINIAKKSFKESSNIHFKKKIIPKGLDSIITKYTKEFNIILVSGLLLYMNDKIINDLFDALLKLASNNCLIYFREPVSLARERLTLNNHFSKDLNTRYSAIYRTTDEYHLFYDKLVKNNFYCYKAGELLTAKLKNREETTQYFWIYNRVLTDE